jgi:GDPmannose 4,6-dehydratase
MEAVYLMLQQTVPQNFVIATGETHSVREFVELAFKEIGIEVEWRGDGVDEIGIKRGTDEILVKVNPKYYRDIDIECLIGDASRAKTILNWSYDLEFKDLVQEMVDAAIKRIK